MDEDILTRPDDETIPFLDLHTDELQVPEVAFEVELSDLDTVPPREHSLEFDPLALMPPTRPTTRARTRAPEVIQHSCEPVTLDIETVLLPVSILALVPYETAREHAILPIRITEDRIALATATLVVDPIIDELEFATGRSVDCHLCDPEALASAIDEAYATMKTGGAEWRGARVEDPRPSAPELPGPLGIVLAIDDNDEDGPLDRRYDEITLTGALF